MSDLTAIGHLTDATFSHFVETARCLGAGVSVIDAREVVETGSWRFTIGAAKDCGFVEAPDVGRLGVSDLGPVYSRLVSLEGTYTGRLAARWRNFTHGMRAALESHAPVVINRPGRHAHNVSKPLHEAWIVANGLRVPHSVTSSDPSVLECFSADGPTICKPCSGVRSETFIVTARSFKNYSSAQGPVHLQRLITGMDYRVHVIGDRTVTVRIESDAVDYRAGRNCPWYEPSCIPADLESTLIRVTARMGITFAGWDLKLDRSGRYWVLEANLMPAYRLYDLKCDRAITEALLEVLADGESRNAIDIWEGYGVPPEMRLNPDSAAVPVTTHRHARPNSEQLPQAPFIPASRRADVLASLAVRSEKRQDRSAR